MVKVGSSILAGWGGYCVGLILVETIFAWTQQDWLFWVVTIGCAVAAGVRFRLARALQSAATGVHPGHAGQEPGGPGFPGRPSRTQQACVSRADAGGHSGAARRRHRVAAR